MTLLHKNKDASEQPLLRTGNDSGASSSGVPPPSFEESAGHVVVDLETIVDIFPAGGEEPPEFTPYDAEHWVTKSGEIISHDRHLNEDGEALYRFLLSQAETPPSFRIHCRGTHNETRTRLVERTDSRGRKYTDTEAYAETVTDFDFAIDQHVPPRATQWTVGDEVPAYRGRMSREVGAPGGATKADRDTTKAFKSWLVERRTRGLPPWMGPQSDRLIGSADGVLHQPRSAEVLKSSWTLRQWADDYCQSRKIFKEFVYEKVIYGWNLDKLEAAVRTAIKSTHYRGDIDVAFKVRHQRVIVRPDTVMSRAISNPWLKFILMITLIYPCIWLFQRFHSRGGGRWAVGGGAYALKRWAPVPEGAVAGTYPGVQNTVEGPRVLIGEREGQWFKRWEGTIRRSVMGRRVLKIALDEPDEEVTNWPARVLDGMDESVLMT
ncbi:hypothetical protein BJV78DRAFT_1124070 [Lactifluus subvellereus]|nr:hypothetical protein BJV78DRAFT_1124070 [Lactifluus subvellereus]